MKKIYSVNNSEDVLGLFSGLKSRITSTKPALTLLMLLTLCGFSTSVWANSVSSANSSSDISSGKIVMSGNHATFTFSGDKTVEESIYGYSLGTISRKSSASFKFTWTKNDDCSIKVTKIAFKVRAYNTQALSSSNGKIVFNGSTTSIGTIDPVGGWHDFSAENSNGLSSGMVVKCKNDAKLYPFDYYIKDITITYTITPSAPGVNPTTASVDVTLDTNDKKKVNLTNYFSVSDETDFRPLVTYAKSGGSFDGTYFYATDSGSYTVNAYIDAKKDCHAQSATSSNLTITVNPRLQSFNVTNGSVDISKTGDVVNLDLRTLVSNYSGYSNATPSFAKVTKSGYASTSNATISGYNFSATATGTYRVKVTYAGTKQYRALSKEFNVVVNKRTPSVVFAMTGEDDHIYSGDKLNNMAKVQYNNTDVPSEQVGFWYWFDNPSWFSKNMNDTMQIMVSTEYSQKTKATLHVTTKETSYYKSVTASHEYDLEVKRTPEFYLNGVLLDKTQTTNLYLEIDSTAQFTFDKITDGFAYPETPSHFTYNNETGVLTATVAGDETFFFNEPGDGITFQHQCNLHLYVSKHETELELSSLVDDNTVWMVDDSVAESSIYELVNGDTNVPVVISSDKTSVIAKENGKWVAKGKGSAVLTIAQVNSDKWSGDTITRTINVNRYTPTFDWSGLPDTLNFNTTFVNPVRSTSDGAITYKSNKSAVTVTNDSTTLHTAETADNAVTITAIQKPTYKYEGKTATKTVKVLKLRNHVKVEVKSNETYLAVRKNTEGDVSWVGGNDNAIRLGGSSTGITSSPAWNWNDKYIDIKFEGIPKTISFTTGLTSNSATQGKVLEGANGFWYMVEHTKNGNWHNSTLWEETESSNPGNISKDLQPNTDMVRICYTGNFAGYVKNLTITERTELSIDGNVEILDFGSTDAGSNPTKKNFTFDWYNLNPLTLSIEGGDGKYSVSPSSISSKKDSFALNESVEVSYIHTAGGTHNADLVISEGTTVLKRIPLTGTTNKVTPAITWKENLSPMSRGENVTDPAEAIVELVYTSSDSMVVDVEGNVLKPLKKGTATITASYDGSENLIYKSNSSSINVLVTNLAVQHIHWTQGFTRLKWSDDPVLSEKNTPDFGLDATVSYYDPETEQEVEITDRAISYTSGNEAVVKVLEGNKLHVVGQGNTTLTAHINGITDSLYEATVVRDVIVREPTLDCEKWVLENKSASMATEINSFSGVETVYDLTGEPGYLSFEAWREAIHVIKDWTDGNLFVAEYVNSEWQEITGNDGLALDLNYAHRKAFDSIPMSREATQVKIFKKTGSTGIHAFSNAYVTLARYLELENTKNKKTHSINLTTTEAKPGVAVEKTFTVNYSNITDQLDVELKHGDKFSIVSDATIGNECGDKGNATVRVRFLSNDVDLYKDTLLVHNLTDTVLVYLSADVDRLHQQITWNPSTLNLLTTDNVTFDAVTSAAAAGRTISYAVTAGSDVASVNAATGALTIIQNGDVTIEASAAGNDKYYDAEAVSYTFHIEKVTPTITKAPTASAVTLPATLAASTWLEAGTASVAGTFAWTNPSTALVAGDIAYEVTFTPENTNWYTTATCMVTPQVSKASQTITWDFNVTEMYGNADYTFDATASSGLQVAYSSSNDEIASVNGVGHLVLHQGGEVTITASQSGDGTYLPASESRTFTILRWTPTIAENPVGGEMYVGRVLSDASLTGGRAEVNGQTIQGSFNWENANSATIDVPGPTTHNVIFVPQNGNFYNEVNCGPIELTVLRYVPVVTSNTLSADGIEFPLTLENSHIHGSVTAMDYVHIPNVEVTGHVEWKEPTTILRPGKHTATALFVPDNNDWYEAKEIPLSVQVTGGYVFKGENNTAWTEEGNWEGNLIPTSIDDPVLINTDVEITSEVTVGSLTIAEKVNVIIKDGGKLRIGNSDSETRAAYGNLRVENGGKVIFGEGVLKVNDFVLEAQLGDADNTGKSGQVFNPASLDVRGNAYFELALDPTNECTYGWYDFTVPFPVDALNGVTRYNNGTHVEQTITNEVHYAIMDFSESRRVATGYGWKKFRGIMQPGQCYTITTNNEDNVYRFKKTADGAFNTQLTTSLAYSSDVESDVRGWNCLGNGTMAYADLSAAGIEKVQLYSHGTNSYIPVNIDEYTYVVGSAYFIQALAANKEITYTHSGANHTLRAPKQAMESISEFALSLTNETQKETDRLYVGASEDALNVYEAGRELTKFAAPTEAKTAQVWANAYGLQLCDIDMPLNGGEANCTLGLYAPKAGQYTLSVKDEVEDASLYLTYNDQVIWDLTASPYVFDLAKGTTEGYGLRITARAPQIATGIDETNADSQSVRKVLINNTIYLVTPEGKMYDIVGKSVKY